MSAAPAQPGEIDPERVGILGMSRRGLVVAFDDAAGLGMVEDDGGLRFTFHCTVIAGGVRTIETGAVVDFTVFGGVGGRLEANDLRPR